MGTPLSAEVTAGNRAKATEYNNLRKDAVSLGNYAYNPVVERPITLGPGSFRPMRIADISKLETNTDGNRLGSTDTTTVYGICNLTLKSGNVIKDFTFRGLVQNSGECQMTLNKISKLGAVTQLCDVLKADDSGAFEQVSGDISNTVDDDYTYCLVLTLNPNDAASDCYFYGMIVNIGYAEPF